MPGVHDATRRLPALDSLRGGLLVMMAINHVPSDLHVLTDQPLGLRHSPRPLQPLAAALTDKATLAPLRLINVALMLHLIALAVRTFPARFATPWAAA
jgi:hypothetical protein